MEQKLYNYEIVLKLINGESHLRQIAKDLGCNHMTIKRLLASLIKDNVLDLRVQGKNNIYTIKKTIEAYNMMLMAELYKLNRFLESHPELRHDIIELKKLPAEIIVIFGSYARGGEGKNSDIDIFIETRSKDTKEKASGLNSRFSIKIGSYDRENLLIMEIERNHIIIKGFEIFYEKNKFFG